MQRAIRVVAPMGVGTQSRFGDDGARPGVESRAMPQNQRNSEILGMHNGMELNEDQGTQIVDFSQ